MRSSLERNRGAANGQGVAAAPLTMDVFCQRAVLALVLFILVWSPLAFGSTGEAEFLVIQGATALALALWAVRWWAQRPFRLLWPPVCWAVLVFLGYALVRCQLVPVEYVGREQLTRVIVYATLFFVVVNNLNHKESATIVAMTLILVGFALAFFGVVQFAKHTPKIWGVTRPDLYIARGSGTFVNPNNFAAYLEMIVPLALAYTILSRFGATVKVLLAYAVLAMLAGIAASVSRGGTLAIAATLVLFCIVLLVQRDFWLPALVTLAAILLVAVLFVNEFQTLQRRFTYGIQTEQSDPSSRIDYWRAAHQLFLRSPIWGVGPGHYDVEFSLVRPPRIQDRPEYAHNDYLNTLAEWGSVGMGIVAAAMALLFWEAARIWGAVRRGGTEFGTRTSDRTAFVAGASAGLVAVMLHCVVDFNMQIPADAVTAIVLMALIAAQARFVTEGHWHNPGRTGKILLTALAVGGVCYLTVQEVQKGRETFWVRRAKSGKLSRDQALVCLEKAHEAEPGNPETDFLLGESLRQDSKGGSAGYENKAKEAIQWFARGMDVDRFDARFPLRLGMCLDWIGRPRESTPYFNLAERLDPNNYYVALELGRHYAALGDFVDAKNWMRKSLDIRQTPGGLVSWQLLMENMADPLYTTHK